MQFATQSFTFEFENPSQYPAVRPYELQQIRERSAGGTIHVDTFAAPLRRRLLNFEEMSETDYNGLLDFYLNKVNGMGEEFTFIDERDQSFTARFTRSDLNFSETSYKRFSGRIELEIVG